MVDWLVTRRPLTGGLYPNHWNKQPSDIRLPAHGNLSIFDLSFEIQLTLTNQGRYDPSTPSHLGTGQAMLKVGLVGARWARPCDSPGSAPGPVTAGKATSTVLSCSGGPSPVRHVVCIHHCVEVFVTSAFSAGCWSQRKLEETNESTNKSREIWRMPGSTGSSTCKRVLIVPVSLTRYHTLFGSPTVEAALL